MEGGARGEVVPWSGPGGKAWESLAGATGRRRPGQEPVGHRHTPGAAPRAAVKSREGLF